MFIGLQWTDFFPGHCCICWCISNVFASLIGAVIGLTDSDTKSVHVYCGRPIQSTVRTYILRYNQLKRKIVNMY